MNESDTIPFRDPTLPIADRVGDLLSRMTLEEKCSQMLHESPAIERLGIPSYNWWNECLHGVARAGIATVFPQAIGLAATWHDEFLRKVADIISTEVRAKHHEFLRKGDTGYYAGLTFWTPNINIFRDPRWGRGHETYGECPYLAARLGVAFCKGLQGEDEKYLKVVATPKHYAVHSGPESERHSFDAKVSIKDMRETYLPAFKACVTEAGAFSVMGAYNRTNGEVCCGSKTLLQDILRDEWEFNGYVVSDCWAIKDFHENHAITPNAVASAAMAVKNGCDLNCGCVYEKLMAALEKGKLEEADIDRAVARLMRARFWLGMFDPPEDVPYAQIPYEVNDSKEHRKTSRRAARKSMVLLKNDGVLPLRRDLGAIAVIGPNADARDALLGNYHGTPSRVVTPLDGIRQAVYDETRVWYAEGCRASGRRVTGCSPSGRISEAVTMAERGDVVILMIGLNSRIEGEQGDASNSDAAGDKTDLGLPGLQPELLAAAGAVGKPLVVVNMSGSAVDLSWADEHANAVIQAWYPGQEGGNALADILFGDDSPAARLPVTFYRSIDKVPDFGDYAMDGRTYRFLEDAPLYPFGFGLSYTTFEYSDLIVTPTVASASNMVDVKVTVTNTGGYEGGEVVQVYVTDEKASVRVPLRELRAFKRVRLKRGESQNVRFILKSHAFSLIDEDGRRILEPGTFRVYVGGSQPDPRSCELMGHAPLQADVKMTGAREELPY